MDLSGRDFAIERKIESIKETLHQLGAINQTLSSPNGLAPSYSTGNLDLYYDEINRSTSPTRVQKSPARDPTSSSLFKSPAWDVTTTLDPNRQSGILEEKLQQKDQLLGEMSRLQSELHEKLELVHNKNQDLRAIIEAQKKRIDVLEQSAVNGLAATASNSEAEFALQDLERKYKDTLTDIAVMHDRITVMEKFREEILKENDGLYSKLSAKDCEIDQLKLCNVEMRDELRCQSGGAQSEVQSLRQERDDLLRQIEAKTISPKGRTRRRSNTSRSRSRKRTVSPIGRGATAANSTLLASVKKELGTTEPSTVLPTIRGLKRTQTLHAATQKFIERLSNLMIEFSPSEKKPSLNRIWKWLRRLLEEYMSSKSTWSISELQSLFGVVNATDVVKWVKKLHNEHAKLVHKLNRLNLD